MLMMLYEEMIVVTDDLCAMTAHLNMNINFS